MTFRTYHDVTGTDRSDLAGQVGAQRQRVTDRLVCVDRVIAVMSGKGGVGKSTVTAGLAVALRRGGSTVGVLDADLRSPTVARLLGARGPLTTTPDGVPPAEGTDGVRVMSSDLWLAEGQPLAWREPESEQFVWRGTLEAGTIREFLADVQWGRLDTLLIDLPPGADGVVDLRTLVPDLAGAVAVTIPTEEARRSVERTMRSAAAAGIPLLGVVENMAGYRCPDCDRVRPLFQGTAGAALADKFGVPLLARVPFVPAGMGGAPSAPELDTLAARIMEGTGR